MFSRRFGDSMTITQLRWALAVFFVALAAPSLFLIHQAFVRIEADSVSRHRQMAEDVLARVDARLADALAVEEQRSFSDYDFLIASGDPPAGAPQRSALSSFPVAAAMPGAVGYFQVDADGRLTTPLLPHDGTEPARYGISGTERADREALENLVRDTLARTSLIRSPPSAGPWRVPRPFEAEAADASAAGAGAAEEKAADAASDSLERRQAGQVPEARTAAPPADLATRPDDGVVDQAMFDRIAVDQLLVTVDASRDATAGGTAPTVQGSAEVRPRLSANRGAAPSAEPRSLALDSADVRTLVESSVRAQSQQIRLFASEIEPFQFGRLGTGHFVLFRYAWRGGQRSVQGLLIDAGDFVADAISSAFIGTAIAGVGDLAVRYRNEPLVIASSSDASARAGASVAGSVFYHGRLSPPFANIELEFSAGALPPGPAFALLVWAAVLLSTVLIAGFGVIYRYGARQIRLVRQQQDFVSAVSHELKTPLTSIRMYGEMLRSGWADDEKKKTYYEFIHDESERLSRLIENVLQLARMTRNSMALELERVSAGQLMDLTRSKVGTQVERAGFALELEHGAATDGLCVRVDKDAFAQIMINLVDNAIKFSRGADRKLVRIGVQPAAGRVAFTVRDFGPGVPRSQMRRLFELFYRPDNDVTRAAGGTGIGLALVNRLAAAMHGDVDAVNRDPGAEFRVSFPAAGTVEL